MGTIRVLSDNEIERLLRTAIVGRVCCCDHREDGGRPYVVPLSYGYDGTAVYAHSGPGRRLRMMRANPLVTFEVDEAHAADVWRSVIAEGTFEELDAERERDRALRVIYPEPGPLPELSAQTVVYRIRLTAKSGRYETPD